LKPFQGIWDHGLLETWEHHQSPFGGIDPSTPIDHITKDGKTALNFVSDKGHLLIEHNASSLNQATADGRTELQASSYSGHEWTHPPLLSQISETLTTSESKP
jgi:hypothetical protein